MRKKRLVLTLAVMSMIIISMIAVFTLGKPNAGTEQDKNKSGVEDEISKNELPKDSEEQKDITEKEDIVATEQPLEDEQEDRNIEAPKEKKDVKVKAVYLSANTVGIDAKLDHIIELAKNTELNAVVIDVKERQGMVHYLTEVALSKDHGLVQKLYDVDKVIKKLHDAGIYVIGRIVCFNDNGLTEKRPDLAITRTDGTPWKDENSANGLKWLNPYKQEVIDYIIELSKEAVDKGFDEIQYDYVRFPASTKDYVDYGEGVPTKFEAVGSFLKRASQEVGDAKGVRISADVFGYICISKTTKDTIGQDLESLGLHIDSLCPMVYPSHYSNGAPKGVMSNKVGQKINGILYASPDLDPYGVVYNTLLMSKERVSQVSGYKATFRPYLQAFTAAYLPSGYYKTYGAKEIRDQIKAVYDAGYEEWILWNSENKYPEEAFLANP